MASANSQLRDKTLQHLVYFRGFSNDLAEKVAAILRDSEADIVAEIQRIEKKLTTSPLTKKRMNELLKSVVAVNNEAFDATQMMLEEQGRQLAINESEFAANSMASVSGLDKVDVAKLQPSVVSDTVLAAIATEQPIQGKLLKDWIADGRRGRVDKIEQTLRVGVAEGLTVDEMTRRLVGTKAMEYTDGVFEGSRRGAKSLAITYASHVSNAAREATYNENEELIKGVEWVSTLDGRTSSVCQARDGEVYPLNAGPRPPAHIRCRSTTVPVLKSWKELGIDMEEAPSATRASMDGQVSDRETYQSWLKKKPEAFQDHVLGKERAKLFREGKETLSGFVDLAGHKLTLDQLKARDRFADAETMIADTKGVANSGTKLRLAGSEPSAERFAGAWADAVQEAATPRQFMNVVGLSGGKSLLSVNDGLVVLRQDGGSMFGKDLKRFYMSVDAAQKTARIDMFDLGKENGSGVARNLFNELIPMLEQMGVTRVTLDAGLNAGGYAWARYGFVNTERGAIAKAVEKYIELLDTSKLSAAAVEELKAVQRAMNAASKTKYEAPAIAMFRTPNLDKELASQINKRIGKAPGNKTFMKAALVYSNWEGELMLRDTMQMAILRNYIGGK